MKFLSAVFILILISSCSTYQKVNGVYVSNINDTIFINKNARIKRSKAGYDNGVLLFKQNNTKLKFKTTWYHHHLFFRYPHKIYFNIIKSKNDSLIIIPLTKWAKLLFENTDTIFLKKVSNTTKTIEL